MKRILPWIGAVLSGLLACVAIAMAFVSANVSRTAHSSLQGALELHSARLSVAAAERELGGGDIDAAIDSARQANARAKTVGAITEELVATLRPTSRTAAAITKSSERSAQNVAFTRRQASVANDLIGAVAGYQRAASRIAGETNQALERILAALRETNRSFPNLGPP